jgi:membrane protease YdiL (CAAX protease family)
VALATVLAVMGLAGQDLPQWAAFASFNGLPDHGVFSTLVLVLLLNGFGEEAGWRGYLLDRLQRRFDPLPATLIVSLVWAVWHAPFFFILSTYAGFNAMTLVMFPLGLTSGAIVLTWLYNHTGGSILAVAVWHTLYNLAVATGGATDLIQGIVTAMIMVAAAVLVVGEVLARRRGRSVLGVEPRM